MADTGSRTLRLLSLLQSHRHWRGDDLATRLGVSARTLRRDIDRLRELGYPVTAHRGTDGGYQLAAGATLPPLVMDDEEAVALVVGLQAATRIGAVAGAGEASARVLSTVLRVMPTRLRRRAEALSSVTDSAGWWRRETAGGGVEPGVLVVLAPACRDGETVRCRYEAADGTRTERHLEPHRLVCLGRRWYLVAYDLTRQDWRSLRVDRLDEPRTTGERFRHRRVPGGDPAAWVRERVGGAPRRHRVEVLVTAPPAAVRSRMGDWATVEATDDPGQSRLRMNVDDLAWPAVALAGLDADFRIVHPPELRELLHRWAERLHRA
ncbi:helix-turn-helix transcriptional regulator [Streptomyces bohaiensis]|uniref:YafY family transcriptional regulator n=1 Tax=Streptomyces bohaiensis TaxID=1431344 RepID=A0ABX1CAS1_9ACTN|nr:YafY family protein [Streptomyces bohaiensis]NJQ14487.1 YafY family transcriptional regulator [Streptomyces bohaiensis]